MQVLNGKELEQAPLLICSFGGGQGGYSYHYRYVRIDAIDHGVIRATGFSVPPGTLKAENLFCIHGDVLYGFLAVCNSKFRDGLRDLLLNDALDKAIKTQLEVAGRTGYKELERAMLRSKRQQIIATGHWQYIGPDMSRIKQSYVICFDENFRNMPAHDFDDQELAFGTLGMAQSHLKEMGADGDGMYIVHRTEEIVDD
jgi:hypothetical protein